MSEGFIKTLETKIDTNKNLKLEEQEILDFIKQEENLQALGKELQNICHQSPDRLGNFGKSIKSICEKILQKGGESIDQIRILMFFKEYAGKQFPDINKQIQTFINRKHLEQEIDQATTEALQNSINNLKELGIDTRIIPNWTLLFQTIKHPQDLSNITLENLKNFLPLPNTVIPENLPYILANFQEIIAEHLHINPGYLSFIGNNGRATGTSLEQTSKGNQYRKTILHNIESIHRKKNLQEKIAYALKSGDIFELWLKKEISSLKGEAQIQAKISKIFTILDDQQTEILLSFMHNKEKNDSKSFLGGLKEVLFHTYLEKKNAYTTTIEKEQILTPEGIDILTPLLKKYGSKAFESLVENSKIINTFYTEAEKLGFSRAIARNDIINLYSKSQATIQEINKLEEDLTKTKNERNKYFYPTTSYGVSTRTIQDGVDGSITAKKKHELMVTLAEEYTSVLLKDPNNKGKKITAPEVFGGFTLDFSKGNSPQTIVRDSFGEKITDQRDLFVDNLKNDKQAAFGSLCGMVGGCTLAGASVFSGNIWATSAGFTAGLKIGNGLGQEVWNGGEYLYTKRGGSLEGTYNQVDKFGNSFLRGIGSHEFKRDQNGNLIKDHNGKIEQEFIGWDRLAMNLGFDYLSTLATFGLSQKFKGMISQIAQVKGIGQGLKFGFEELVLENFFVDIPMNIVQTGMGTLTGIDSKIKTGQTALGNKEGTPTHTSYQSNSLSDMLSAMKEATEENLSFENLSQTFFSTIIYGGLLEGGGAAINKIKSYLPQNQVINFEHSSKAATLALGELKNFMSQNKLSFNKEGHCINTVSKQPLLPSDIKTKELMKHLQNIEGTKKAHLETLEAIQKTHKSMLEDPESKPGLLFKLGLLSSTNTPLNILEKKLTLCEQKIKQAKQKGDQKTVRQLEQLKAEYLKVKAMLSEPSSQINTNQDTGKNEIELPSAYFGGKISKFGLLEAQARQNSQWMDQILSTINETNQAEQLQFLNATISKQYQEITGKEIHLNEEQLHAIIDAHKQDGTLGELRLGELKKKVAVLDTSITDPEIRRFLLEAGFVIEQQNLSQKKYGLKEIATFYENINNQLKINPNNILLQRKKQEYSLAIAYMPEMKARGIGELNCINPDKGIYSLETEKGKLFGSIYSIIDADESLCNYEDIAQKIAFSKDNLVGIKVAEGIKFISTMVNSGSFAQSKVHPYPADLDFGEHIKISSHLDNAQEIMGKHLSQHIQTQMKKLQENTTNNLQFTGAKIGYYPDLQNDGKPQSLKWTQEELIQGIHKETQIKLEDACSNPGFFKFDYILIDTDGIPKECTKVISVTLEKGNKIEYTNLLEGVGAQEIYYSDPSEYTMIEALYEENVFKKYTEGFLLNDIIKYASEKGNLLKSCKRLYNYIKLTDTSQEGRKAIQELSQIFRDPIFEGAALIDAIKLTKELKGKQENQYLNIHNIVEKVSQYTNKHLIDHQNEINEQLKRLEKTDFNDNTIINNITTLITNKMNTTVNEYLEKSPTTKKYLKDIIAQQNR